MYSLIFIILSGEMLVWMKLRAELILYSFSWIMAWFLSYSVAFFMFVTAAHFFDLRFLFCFVSSQFSNSVWTVTLTSWQIFSFCCLSYALRPLLRFSIYPSLKEVWKPRLRAQPVLSIPKRAEISFTFAIASSKWAVGLFEESLLAVVLFPIISILLLWDEKSLFELCLLG